MLDEHVEVAHRTEQRSEPLELGSQALGPPGLDEAVRGAEECPCAPRRHAGAVQRLGILAETDARIVREQLVVLLGKQRAQASEAVCRQGVLLATSPARARPSRERRGCDRAGPAQLLADRRERRAVPRDGLGLDLGEPTGVRDPSRTAIESSTTSIVSVPRVTE